MRRRRPKHPARAAARAQLPSGNRLLAEEVLYLHSLWRRGPPGGSGSLADKRKRRRVETVDEPPEDGTGSEWPLAPSPPASPNPTSWPEASSSSPHGKQPPPPPQPSPGSLAQRAALRAAEEFFSGGTSDDDEGSESEDEDREEEAAGFFMGLFERDAALRGYYERSCEDGEFTCLGCAGRKARRGKARRFRDCVGLTQHARASTRCGRPRAHRALAATVCRVLGWDIDRLPSVVMDTRGTLSQALATEGIAAAAAPHEENDGSSSDEDAAKKDDGSGMISNDEVEDVDTGKNERSLSDQDAAKEDVDTGKGAPLSSDNDGEVHEQDNGIGSAEKEDTADIDLLSSKDTLKEELCKTVQEEEGAIDKKQEQAQSADDTRGTCIISLGNNSLKEEAPTVNKRDHANDAAGTGEKNLGNNSVDSPKENLRASNCGPRTPSALDRHEVLIRLTPCDIELKGEIVALQDAHELKQQFLVAIQVSC